MAGASFVIGKGTIVEIALLPVGDETTPARVTLTTTNAVSAKDTTPPATITLSAAIGAGILIPAGTYLNFVAPTTGKEVLVQLTADAKTGDSALTVNTIPEAIAASSVATFPLRLRARTEANLDRKGNLTSAIDFDSDGYARGLTTSIEQTLSLPGNWLPLDAGFATAEYAFTELRPVYVWLTLPKISAAYSKGRVYHGPASITSLPLEVKADGVIGGNIELQFNGKPNYEPDTPA
jgi:hypothetical protein